jgi:hypothetical protein
MYISEGKKKELRRAFDQGLRDGRPEIVTKAPPESSAPTAPGSPERMAQIKREILGQSGGGKVEKAQKDKNKAFKKRRKEAIERIANKPKPKLNVTKVDAKKTFREFMELVESSTGERSGNRNSLGRHRDKQLTSGPSRSRAGLDRQKKSASDKAAFRKAGMKSTQSGGNRQRFNSTNDKNQYSKTITTSYPSQSAYAKDSMPEKERRGKTVPTKDRAVFLRRLKKQLKTTRTPRGVHAVDVLPRHEYKKNDPRELISRGKEYHRVVKEIPQEVKNAGGKPGDKMAGRAAEVMSGSKNMEKGKKSRQKLYSKSLGATKSDPITKVQVASVKEEVE